MNTMIDLINKTMKWHFDRNLIDGSDDLAQFTKLMEETLELQEAIVEADLEEIKDAIGDIMVVLVNIATRNNLTLRDCLAHAYDEIKDRTGTMKDGVFVKDE